MDNKTKTYVYSLHAVCPDVGISIFWNWISSKVKWTTISNSFIGSFYEAHVSIILHFLGRRVTPK